MDSDIDATDDAEFARAIRLRRRVFGLAGLFLALLTVGTSLIFAGHPGIGITLVTTSPLALLALGWLLVRG
ncbi:hypothetical protein [Halalkalicoccus subterraneus]|uniref:hypothetical protein n=1 Tax=Halalkalicoccus subterraneus TaxID=2675002 RepID=UPI000EFBB120|nr:hypothetical protein [Halalkalicoccus subterraneus]